MFQGRRLECTANRFRVIGHDRIVAYSFIDWRIEDRERLPASTSYACAFFTCGLKVGFSSVSHPLNRDSTQDQTAFRLLRCF